jgi:hypothetical protein
MKTKIKISTMLIVLGAALIPTIQSCKKYPEGPVVSLKSRTERVANTWKVENVKRNGTDVTSLYGGYSETFTKNGDYSYIWGMFGGTGTWSFQKGDSEIKLTGTSQQESHTLVILKLQEKEFWYSYVDGDDKFEFHLVQK